VMLTTLTLPSEACLLIVSSTRKNFSASMARPHWWLICETYTPAACADTAIELGAIAASRQPPCRSGRFRFSVEGSHSVVSGAISVDCMSYKMPAQSRASITATAFAAERSAAPHPFRRGPPSYRVSHIRSQAAISYGAAYMKNRNNAASLRLRNSDPRRRGPTPLAAAKRWV
jgi:hypothetical protein